MTLDREGGKESKETAEPGWGLRKAYVESHVCRAGVTDGSVEKASCSPATPQWAQEPSAVPCIMHVVPAVSWQTQTHPWVDKDVTNMSTTTNTPTKVHSTKGSHEKWPQKHCNLETSTRTPPYSDLRGPPRTVARAIPSQREMARPVTPTFSTPQGNRGMDTHPHTYTNTSYKRCTKQYTRTSKTSQWVKVLAAKSDNLSSIPGSHMLE